MDQPAKRSQKNTDARWTRRHGKSHYGYENHVNVDRRHKPVRRYQVTDPAARALPGSTPVASNFSRRP